MRPFCSRSRSPSARKRKSNFARSAVRAKCTNEENSMWLPAAGSLHTVVLLTPGKCAARWICLRGIGGASSGAERVAVGGPRQPEQAAEGVGFVGRPVDPAPLELGDQPTGDLTQVVRQGPGSQ